MTLVRNVRPYAVAVGGRALAPLEAADLDVNAPEVAEQVDLGHLVPVPEPVPAPSRPARPARPAPEES